MRYPRTLTAVLLAAILGLAALPAFAATTFTAVGPSLLSGKATCTTGTETAPGAGTRDGAYAAGTTYSAGDYVISGGIPYVSLQGSNAAHTPANSPTWWAVAGVPLSSTTVLDLMVCAASTTASVSISTAGKIDFYYFDPTVAAWSKTDISIVPPAGSGAGYHCVSSRGDSPGWGLPILNGRGWLLALPNGTAASDAGGANAGILVYLLASNATRSAL